MARERKTARPSAAPRGDEGMMMLLASIVLAVGLIALAALVSSVGPLSQEAQREQDRPLLREAEPMKTSLDTALSRLTDSQWAALTAGSAAHDTAVRGVLTHLRQLEASRGFQMEWSLTCDNNSDVNTGRAVVSLSDGESWIEVKSQNFKRLSCP